MENENGTRKDGAGVVAFPQEPKLTGVVAHFYDCSGCRQEGKDLLPIR